MRVEVTKGQLTGWSEYHIFDNGDREIMLRRPDAESLTRLLIAVLQLEIKVELFPNKQIEQVNEELLEALSDLLNVGPCDRCYEEECGGENRCTLGTDGEPCLCHKQEDEAREKAQAAYDKATEGR